MLLYYPICKEHLPTSEHLHNSSLLDVMGKWFFIKEMDVTGILGLW